MDLSYEQFKSPTNKSSSLKLDLSYEAFKNPPEKKPGFWSELGTDVWKAIKEPFLSAPAKQVGEIPTLTTVEGGKEALQAGVDVLSSAIQDSANRNIKAIEGWTDPNTGKLQEAVNIGSAGVGILNALFAGMTAPIKVATKLPTVENIAKSAESFFGAIGVTGGKISKKSIDVLPISDEAKEIITPLAEEIGALAAQIVGGKYSGKILDAKKTELSIKTAQIEEVVKSEKTLQPEPTVSTPEPVIKPEITTPDLLTQAKNYATPEEFVKAQGMPVYHGGSLSGEINLNKSNFNKTFYISDSADYAKSFGGNKSVVSELRLSPEAKLADMRKPDQSLISQLVEKIKTKEAKNKPYSDKNFSFYPYSTTDVITGIRQGKAHFAELPQIKDILRELGYDGQITAEVPYAKNIGIWNKDIIKTSSQLTDIWKKANEGAQNTSGLAQTTKTEAQAVGMKVDFEDMPGYSQRNQTTAAKLADDFVSNSPDNAKAVLEGNMNPPDGLLVGDVYSALKRTYLKTGDVAGIMGLIRSKANDVATYFGQQVKAFDSGIRITDPVAAIKIISESRAKNKGIKNVESIVAKESSSIKESVKKSLRDNRTWEDFVNQIKC